MTRSNASRFCQSARITGNSFCAQSSCARIVESMIWRRVTFGSCLLINRHGFAHHLVPEVFAQPCLGVEIHLPTDDLGQFLAITEKLQSGPHAGRELRQHVHVAACRIEVLAQHRAEQAQLADAARTAERRDLLAVNLDGHTAELQSLWHLAYPLL